MRFITMDDEGRDLLEAAGEMAHAALAARVRRRDPDEILSKSLNMSKLKTEMILNQLRQPPLAKWSELSPAEQEQFRIYMTLDTADFDAKDWEALFSSIRSLCLRRAPGPALEDPAQS